MSPCPDVDSLPIVNPGAILKAIFFSPCPKTDTQTECIALRAIQVDTPRRHGIVSEPPSERAPAESPSRRPQFSTLDLTAGWGG
jgi:hypothetical protein